MFGFGTTACSLKAVDSKRLITVYNVKDHKEIPLNSVIPDTRDICKGKEGPILRLQCLTNLRLDKYPKSITGGEECINTRDMKEGFNQLNENLPEVGRKQIIMSLNVLIKILSSAKFTKLSTTRI